MINDNIKYKTKNREQRIKNKRTKNKRNKET